MRKAFWGFAAALFLAGCGQGGEREAAAPEAAGAACGGGEGIVVSGAWVRAAAEGQPTTAAYFTLCNAGGEEDALLSAGTEAARAVEMHETVKDAEGVTGMTPVDAVALPPGEKVSFAPGGLHLMLIGLNEAIPEGGEIRLTLNFRNAPSAAVAAKARAPGAMNDKDMKDMDHGG